MAKVRIHEISKELGIDNKVIIEYLNGEGIEVKTASSGVEEDVAAKVKEHFSNSGSTKSEAKAESSVPKESAKEAAKEAPKDKKVAPSNGEAPKKKKNVTMVFNTQYTQGGNNENRRPKRPEGERQAKPAPSNQSRGPIRPREFTNGIRPSQRASVPEEEFIPSTPKKEENAPSKRAEVTKKPENNFKNDNKKAEGNRPDNRKNDGNRPSSRPQQDNKSDKPKKTFAGFNKPAANQAPAQESNPNKDNRRDKNAKKPFEKDGLGKNKQERVINLEKNGGKKKKPQAPKAPERNEDEILDITIPEHITIKDLAELMKVQASVVVKKLFLKGIMVNINQEVDYDKAEEIALEFNCIAKPAEKVDVIAELLKEEEDDPKTLKERPPVVCVMGHVDHGKTSLLDAIRDTRVTAREAGGITQHIGAYMVNIDGRKITFLDTPGHEAFTAMRMRGANSTDIAILVVAADDGVMPQTVEAINHAKAAGVEIIVAINKIDKPGANIERVKQELSEYELIPEDWGGSTIFVPVSAHTKEGIEDLLEMILLTADVLELKANPKRNARGLVIEAQLDKGRGAVATMLVQKGTLHVGDPVACGSCYGKVRAMLDDTGKKVEKAGPSVPVEILGLSDVPNAGEIFVSMDSEKEARQFAETFISENKNKLIEETRAHMSLDDLFSQIQSGNVKELNIIVKADVQGSVEAVKQSLIKLSNDEVVVKIIHGGVGAINESDVVLASASNAIIIGFNVRPDNMAKSTAEREGVDVRLYRVIYDAIADVEAAMKGMLDPIYEEKIIGHAEVRQIFKASGVGNICGSYVLDGYFTRDCKLRISREGTQIFEGEIASLKRFKDDVKEVKAGYECGIVIDGFDDVQELDIIESYIMVEVPR